MIKPTKRPKKVSFKERKITGSVYDYKCPTCYTLFSFHYNMVKVTRFKCDCGQELIVDEIIKD